MCECNGQWKNLKAARDHFESRALKAEKELFEMKAILNNTKINKGE